MLWIPREALWLNLKGFSMDSPNTGPDWWPQLQARLQEHYQVMPEAMGSVRLVVRDLFQTWSVWAEMGEELSLRLGEGQGNAGVELALPIQVLHQILREPQAFEPRDEFFSRNIAVRGDMRLAHHFAQLLKRPNEYALQILNVVQQHPNVPQAVLESSDLNLPDLARAVLNNQPICFRQVFVWPSMRWDLDEFDRQLGALPIRFNAASGELESLADLTQKLRQSGGERVYTSGMPLPEQAEASFPFPADLPGVTTPPQIWLGQARKNRLLCKLHCDIFTSLFAQVWGNKTVHLYPPQHHQYLYPMASFSGYQPCLVDPLAPDLTRHPEFGRALHLKVEIRPGDVLVIPSGWYYCLGAEDPTLSVSRGLPLEVAHQLTQ